MPTVLFPFGQMLRKRRKELGMTLKTLSSRSGVNLGDLSRIERRKRRPPDIVVLLKISDALKIRRNSPEHVEFMKAAIRDRYPGLSEKIPKSLYQDLADLQPVSRAHNPVDIEAVRRREAEREAKQIPIRNFLSLFGLRLVFWEEERDHTSGRIDLPDGRSCYLFIK